MVELKRVMTKENLLRYLRDPEYLHQISYQELKTLVAEHPNSYTLRHLLAVKSRQEGNDDYQRQKEFAALYSIDRPHLFDVLSKSEILETLPEGVLLQEDFLELKELSALEKELSMTSVVGAAAASTAIASTIPMDTPTIQHSSKDPLPAIELDLDEEVELGEVEIGEKVELGAVQEEIVPVATSEEYYTLDFEEDILEEDLEIEEDIKSNKIQGNLAEIEALFEDVDSPSEGVTETVLNPVSIDSITSKEIADDTLVNTAFIEIPLDIVETEEQVDEPREMLVSGNPIPKSKFSTWKTPTSEFSGFDLIGFNSKGMIDELANKKVKKDEVHATPVPAPTDNFIKEEEEANDNLEFESDIASETLAKILIIQGHYTKAIVMYKRLSLIFPEKSGLFAAEIKKIENLEDRSA